MSCKLLSVFFIDYPDAKKVDNSLHKQHENCRSKTNQSFCVLLLVAFKQLDPKSLCFTSTLQHASPPDL